MCFLDLKQTFIPFGSTCSGDKDITVHIKLQQNNLTTLEIRTYYYVHIIYLYIHNNGNNKFFLPGGILILCTSKQSSSQLQMEIVSIRIPTTETSNILILDRFYWSCKISSELEPLFLSFISLAVHTYIIQFTNRIDSFSKFCFIFE